MMNREKILSYPSYIVLIFCTGLLFKFLPIFTFVPLEIIFIQMGIVCLVWACLIFVFFELLIDYFLAFNKPILNFSLLVHGHHVILGNTSTSSFFSLYCIYVFLFVSYILGYLTVAFLRHHKMRTIAAITSGSLVWGVLVSVVFLWMIISGSFSIFHYQISLLLQFLLSNFFNLSSFGSSQMGFLSFFMAFQNYIVKYIVQFYIIAIFAQYFLTVIFVYSFMQKIPLYKHLNVMHFSLPRSFAWIFIVLWSFVVVFLFLDLFHIVSLTQLIQEFNYYTVIYSLCLNIAYVFLILFCMQGFSFLTFVLRKTLEFRWNACFFIQIMVLCCLLIKVTRIETLSSLAFLGLLEGFFYWRVNYLKEGDI